jgi:hypothetical protein
VPERGTVQQLALGDRRLYGLHPTLEWIEYVPPEEEEPEGWIGVEPAAKVLGAALKETLDPRERTGQLGGLGAGGRRPA